MLSLPCTEFLQVATASLLTFLPFSFEIFQRSRGEMFMMGLVNRLATEVIRSPEHPWSKWLGKSGPEL